MFAYVFCLPITYIFFLHYNAPKDADIVKIFSANFGTLYGTYLDVTVLIFVFGPLVRGCYFYRKTSNLKYDLK